MRIVKPRPNSLLLKISDPPQQLYCYGDESLLDRQCLTIVGTRNMTQYGARVLDMFLTPLLKKLDIVVVSGLAKGVDVYTHRKCLERGIKTIGVVPGSIDSAIPLSNRKVCKEMIKTNLVVAEYPEGIKFNKYMYIQRNRILAGVSQSTVIIEAGENSGSLTTAKLALDYNRDVYVVPGNITSEVSKGCNMLAQQGANILTSLSDFKEIVGVFEDQRKFFF